MYSKIHASTVVFNSVSFSIMLRQHPTKYTYVFLNFVEVLFWCRCLRRCLAVVVFQKAVLSRTGGSRSDHSSNLDLSDLLRQQGTGRLKLSERSDLPFFSVYNISGKTIIFTLYWHILLKFIPDICCKLDADVRRTWISRSKTIRPIKTAFQSKANRPQMCVFS